MPAPTNQRVSLSPEFELRKIVSLRQAAELRGVSPDTLKRNFPSLIVQLSPRRLGMTLGDALGIGRETVAPNPIAQPKRVTTRGRAARENVA